MRLGAEIDEVVRGGRTEGASCGGQPLRRTRRRSLAIILITLLTIIGCGGESKGTQSTTAISDDEFIEIYLELREAAVEADSDSTKEFAELRDEILERYEIEPDDLFHFIDQKASDLEGLSLVWDSIYQRMKERRGGIDS